MSVSLSHTIIESFCGDVLPLWLCGSEDLSAADIRWSVSGDAVTLRTFAGEEGISLRHAVLLTLIHPGDAVVSADMGGCTYCCSVSVRPMRRADPAVPMQFYRGDFHDHTTQIHKHGDFAARTADFPADYIAQIKAENRLDFCVISDHGIVLNDRDFVRGFMDERRAQPMDTVVFPGSESEITVIEQDRYGFSHKNSGEIVTVNANNYCSVRNWEDFFSALSASPFAVCALAHPQIIGYDSNGIWNFCLHKNNSARMKELVRLVEIGNGGLRQSNLINEYIYSVALDNGFRVSTSCSSDCHGPKWGFDVFPGKTVIMAQEKSKEAFLDALLNNRVYACESGNLQLICRVNGMPAPAELPLTDTYAFHVEIGYFADDPSTAPVRAQVISDGGETVYEQRGTDLSVMDFTVHSESAHYFFLRLTDANGRKTWSPPIWTGRVFEEISTQELTPLDKSGFRAVDLLTGRDASALICDDPENVWSSDSGTAEILIDMQKPHTFSAIGHYPPRLIRSRICDAGEDVLERIAMLACEYEISTSEDGISFTAQRAGALRVFGGEELLHFPAHRAQYIKVKILSTVGKASGHASLADMKLTIGELSVFA